MSRYSKYRYFIRQHETGTEICECDTLEEALETLVEYEDDDRYNDQFKEDYYEFSVENQSGEEIITFWQENWVTEDISYFAENILNAEKSM